MTDEPDWQYVDNLSTEIMRCKALAELILDAVDNGARLDQIYDLAEQVVWGDRVDDDSMASPTDTDFMTWFDSLDENPMPSLGPTPDDDLNNGWTP